MPGADLILKNANIITIDPLKPFARLVAIGNGRIVFVGADDQQGAWQGAGTKVIDCAGKTLVPGFNDAHCHIHSFLRKLLSLDLSPPAVNSIYDIQAVLKRKSDKTPPGQWIVGTDYNDFYLAEKRHPTRWDIDEVAPNHPVILSHRSLHACVLNSRALALAGINRETSEPPGGFISRRAADGEPDGLLLEMLAFIRQKVLPPPSAEDLDRAVRLAGKHYLSQGLTSLQDATYVNDMKRWQRYRHFKTAGLLKSRVYMMVGTETMPQFLQSELSFGSGDEQLRLGAVKIVPGMVSGQLHPPQPELRQQVLDAHRAGFQVAIHGVEEKLIEAIVSVFENVKSQSPDFARRRHRIEHCSECPPHILERLKRLQMVIVTHPALAYYGGDRYLEKVALKTIPYLYPLKALADSGLVVAGASDSPVSPDNPLMGIYGGVMRETSSGQKLPQEQCINAHQVLEFYTINAAYASHEEKIKGSITPGKLADMVLLSTDPTNISPESIKDINVEMTIIGGEVVWEA